MTELLEHQVKELDGIGLLFVDIASEAFAIPIHSVKEVIELTQITSVPMCSNIINGVINVRGSVVPVIDAATRLGMAQTQDYDKYSCIVLYEREDMTTNEFIILGLLVSRVRSIEMVSDEMKTNKPAFGSHIPEQFVSQMIRLKEEVFPILDMATLLDYKVINQETLRNQHSSFRLREQ
ncbi:chemotaxis protein CheW [Vibrio amylolyticus]|uniref:chemotaxis protein CheW n=1 Tax=Vibrio amylolyticus TaxID=2847292 RepID=UPI0035516592